ncbi:MAG: RAMP superfamily CRISPR-associated protein [Campylobacter sp.]|nr:RAMP superfamily CRISPR-associated protein [Campylobacter sp.]
MQTARILKKFLIRAKFQNETAFNIGCGDGDFIDAPVLKDANGLPFIPATSLVGVIRNEFKKYDFDENAFDKFFGSSNRFSAISISDAVLSENGDEISCKNVKNSQRISLRNGIKIDEKSGIAKDSALFDFEVVCAGSEFDFKAEFTLRKMHENSDFKAILDIFLTILKRGFSVGAKTNSGLGKLKNISLEICEYDFSRGGVAFENYINENFTNNYNFALQTPKLNKFELDLILNLKTTLLIGSAYTQTDADIANLKENGDFILSGSSLKGAIRNQALKIARTFRSDENKDDKNKNRDEIVENLFGFVDENEKNAKKGRIKISENAIKNVARKLHQRTKIDRFSGATIDGALFDSEVLMGGDDNKTQINAKITIFEPKNAEIGLLLLVAKDLCTGFLAVGGGKNIGRGVFKGAMVAKKDGKKLSNIELNNFVSDFRSQK